jgi:DNA replication and repair protein RecF
VLIRDLRLRDLRNIANLELELGGGITIFIGANGAGKTSILEGAYLLSHGRSFRTSRNEFLLKQGADRLVVQARVERQAGPVRLALTLADGGWRTEVNGTHAPSLAEALREFGLVCFEPGSHELISGASPERRRFLDWGVFHVEQAYVGITRRYRRALRQRNALLKAGGDDAEMDLWDTELAAAANPLKDVRARYFERLRQQALPLFSELLPELGQAGMILEPGWPVATDLVDSLRQNRSRDRALGHTSKGPHRADWRIDFGAETMREHLSRGQEKLAALVCVLAQAALFAQAAGEWPVIVLDDISSELDVEHQQIVFARLAAIPAQILVTALAVPAYLENVPHAVFHVEHGEARRLI